MYLNGLKMSCVVSFFAQISVTTAGISAFMDGAEMGAIVKIHTSVWLCLKQTGRRLNDACKTFLFSPSFLKHLQLFKTKKVTNIIDLQFASISKCYINKTQIYKYLFYKHINRFKT